MPDVLSPALFEVPAAWRGPELEARGGWIHHLDVEELREIGRVVEGAPIEGALARAAHRWRNELAHGRGFVLVRGVDRLSEEAAQRVFWSLGLHLGTPAPQNASGELLTHVRDTGADPADPSTRLYRTRAEQDFHTDGADLIGLLALKPARSGGASRIVSSVTVVDQVRRRRPDLARVLFEDFPWHYHEPEMPAPQCFQRPICTVQHGRLNTFFIPWYVRRSQELETAPRLTAAQEEALHMVETVANDPQLYLDMDFLPGDIQLLKNAAILHKRTAYEDFDAPEQKRHLLRLWLSAPDFDDGDAELRRGVTLS